MKWFLNPCRRNRQSLCLLASGLLSKAETVRIEAHLAACADCRCYYDEIKLVTAPLAAWEKHFAHIEPDIDMKTGLAEELVLASKPKSVRSHEPKIFVVQCWQKLIWPSRRIWAGLAAVWLVLFAVNISMRDHSRTAIARSSPTPEMFAAWRQQERVLAELIGPNETRVAEPPKQVSPQPRSERLEEFMPA